jgi:hypothetical protein
MDTTTGTIGEAPLDGTKKPGFTTLVLPLFEGVSKAPNRALAGVPRTSSTLVKEAISSDDFSGKSGQSLTIWGSDLRVLLLGMGKSDGLSTKEARDGGANLVAGLAKSHG